MWLLSLDYCMYFYTEITYVLYATSAILNFLFYFLRFPIFLSHEAAICLSVHLYISLEAVYVCSCLCACMCV